MPGSGFVALFCLSHSRTHMFIVYWFNVLPTSTCSRSFNHSFIHISLAHTKCKRTPYVNHSHLARILGHIANVKCCLFASDERVVEQLAFVFYWLVARRVSHFVIYCFLMLWGHIYTIYLLRALLPLPATAFSLFFPLAHTFSYPDWKTWVWKIFNKTVFFSRFYNSTFNTYSHTHTHTRCTDTTSNERQLTSGDWLSGHTNAGTLDPRMKRKQQVGSICSSIADNTKRPMEMGPQQNGLVIYSSVEAFKSTFLQLSKPSEREREREDKNQQQIFLPLNSFIEDAISVCVCVRAFTKWGTIAMAIFL